ncbi:efflux RND transporter permease subunit [Blastopirellula marina]|uniref:Cation efflux system protein n=1 Tax=Blastopirellula marina DSM 3645 TaxID=314230 RepID=A3ZSF5_9BACT|nr:efflux RND transporter permease subunit [Blastopirellula marina]EAQ80615.1 cation efflux system protein [Blastopirellula marina DSM 3645]
MLDAVIRFSLRHRPLILVLSIAVMIYGGYLATTMPIDVFPDLDRPRVVILTECPGLSPEEVETLVTQPIEQAVLGANGVVSVRSQSSTGLVVIYIEFAWDTEIRAARQVVQERLAMVAGVMPQGIQPLLAPPTSIMGQIMHVGVHRQVGPSGGKLAPLGETKLLAELLPSGRLKAWRPVDRRQPQNWEELPIDSWGEVDIASNVLGEETTRRFRVVVAGETYNVPFLSDFEQAMQLRTIADWVVRPRLLQISGIAEVIVLGGEKKQYQVAVDPTALLDFGVSLKQVEDAVRRNNLNASGGYTLEGQQERPIRVIGRLGPEPPQVLADLRKISVDASGQRPVLLAQVAEVGEGAPAKRGDASIDGHGGIVITLVKQPHVDTRGLTDNIHAALADVEASFPADILINRDLFQLKNFIDRGIYYVGEALVIGAVLVVIVLALFLLNFRTTFITLTAIPLSLATTILVFRAISLLTGQELSINVMTLGGLAVAMGELVDDAIVDVENIYRRLKENAALTSPRPALQVVYQASREIRSAIVFGTAVVILVFMPLFAMSGVEGRLFTPLGIAYIVSILSSLVVSLTVTPVLSYYLLPQSKATHAHEDGWMLRSLKHGASFLIHASLRLATPLLITTWILVAVSGWLLTQIGADFLPQFDEGSVQVNLSLPAGSSLQASSDAAAIVDQKLAPLLLSDANPHGELRHFVRRTGRAELDEHAQPVNMSEYILSMNPEVEHSRDESIERLLEDLKKELPGVEVEIDQPLAHLISHMLSGVYAHVAIKIYGDDLNVLQRLARQVKGEISDVPGITTPVIESQVFVDELHIVLRPDALALYGLDRQEVADFVQTALQGETVSQVLEGSRRFDLVVRLRKEERTDYFSLQNLRIDLPNGDGQIKLAEVADFTTGKTGPNQLMRENVRRRMVVRCNTQGRDLGSVVADIEHRVQSRIRLPEGYYVEYGGQFESQRSATLMIGLMAIVSLVGVFVVLLMLHSSVRIVLQILNAIPTAFIGGVAALVITEQTLTVASLVGFVSLGGIAVRNGILLVTHYFHLMEQEGEQFSAAMIMRGSLERLAPVLMTALTAGMGLLPIVAGGQKPGLEILYPVATVIMGGLITSTFCEFLIHPGLFWKFSGRDAIRLAQGEHDEEELLQ